MRRTSKRRQTYLCAHLRVHPQRRDAESSRLCQPCTHQFQRQCPQWLFWEDAQNHTGRNPHPCAAWPPRLFRAANCQEALMQRLLPRWQDFRPLEARYEPTRHCFHRGGYLWLQGVARTSLPYHGLHTGRSPRLAAPSVETLLSLRIRRLPVRLTAHGARRPAICRARHPSI